MRVDTETERSEYGAERIRSLEATSTAGAHDAPNCRRAMQAHLRTMYLSSSTERNEAARALRAENSRRSLVNLRTRWTRPTRTG